MKKTRKVTRKKKDREMTKPCTHWWFKVKLVTDVIDSKKHFTEELICPNVWSTNTCGQGYSMERNHKMEGLNFRKQLEFYLLSSIDLKAHLGQKPSKGIKVVNDYSLEQISYCHFSSKGCSGSDFLTAREKTSPVAKWMVAMATVARTRAWPIWP